MYLPQAANPQAWRDGSSAVVAATVDMTDSGLNHPGGMQALGTTLAVAVECSGCTTAAEVRFYEFGSQFVPTELMRLKLDGSRGEPNQPSSNASSVAFTKLTDGTYLLFVGGNDDGRSGGWFYRSNRAVIDEYTQWKFINYWTPPCTTESVGCWPGASSMSFITECSDNGSGNVYLVGTDGQWALSGPSHNIVTIAKITQAAGTGAVSVQSSRILNPSTYTYGFDISYRWAGGIFVTPNNKLSSDVTFRDVDSNGNLPMQQFIPPDAFQ